MNEAPTLASVANRRRALFLAAGALTWFLLVAPVLPASRQLGERDTARLFYPVERTVAAALRAGRFPFWDARIESGASILGQVTPAALHPFALLYLPLPFGLAFKLEHLLALLLGGCGAAFLAGRLGASPWARLFAGIAFGGSGALVSAASGNLPYALGPSAAPLAVGALLLFLRAPSAPRLLGSAFALSLCVYGGDPQSFGIAILVALVLALLERPRTRRAFHVVAWAACASLLSAPAILPAVAQLRRSERRAGITDEERKMFFTPPVRLFGLAVPLAFDASEPEPETPGDTYSDYVAGTSEMPFLGSICLGAPALLFAAAAVRRRRARPLLVIAAVLIVASTGSAWHVQPLLEAIIPGWSLFRFTEKFLLHASWLLAVAAAMGVDDALTGERHRARLLVVLAAALAAAAFAAFAIFASAEQSLLARLTGMGLHHSTRVAARFLELLRTGSLHAGGLSAVVAALAALRLRREDRRAPLTLAMAAGVAAAVIAPPLRTVRADLYEGTSATARKLKELARPGEGRFRIWAGKEKYLALPGVPGLNADESRLVGFREALWPQLQALDEVDGAALYFSAVDSDYAAVLREATDTALAVLAIRFYVVQPSLEMPSRAILSDTGFGILQRPPSPRAFLVHRTIAADSREAALLALRSLQVFQEAIVPAEGPQLQGGGRSELLALRRPYPEEMDASVRSDEPALLVVSEHYDPGWRAQVDGHDAPVHQTDLLVLGIPVPAGRHEVRLRYRPVGFLPGLACAAAAVVLLGALALRGALFSRSRAPP